MAPPAASAAAEALLRHRSGGALNSTHHHSGLLFNGLHSLNLCNDMDYYSLTNPEGM